MSAPLSRAADDTPVIPGALVAIDGFGVLVTGESGRGKTDLLLGLLDRGHALVADDAVAIGIERGRLTGRCPPELAGLLAVRGLGLMDARALFGPERVRAQAPIELVLDLDETPPGADPLSVARDTRTILSTEIPCLRLPTAGRDAPLLVELAARAERLRRQGRDPQWSADRQAGGAP